MSYAEVDAERDARRAGREISTAEAMGAAYETILEALRDRESREESGLRPTGPLSHNELARYLGPICVGFWREGQMGWTLGSTMRTVHTLDIEAD